MNNTINQFVLEYKSLDGEKVRKKTLLNKIVVEIYNNSQIKNKTIGAINKYNLQSETSFEDIISKLIIIDKIIDKFIPEKYENNFVKYLYGCIPNAIGSIYKKSSKYSNMDRLDQTQQDDDGNDSNKEIKSNENVEKNIIEDNHANILSQLISYNIIHFLEHKGKTYNPTRLNYFKMFYTENMTIFFKSGTTDENLNHQQVFSAMDLNFLDMYMREICRTPNEILYTPLKTYSQLFDDIISNKELKLPLENKVFLKYWEKSTGNKIADANISQQRKAYLEFMKGITAND